MQHVARFFASVTGKCRSGLLKPSTERGYWQGRFDFLLSSIGYSVGLGNIWGFPHLCYSNGGGAFLIAYFFMLILVGVPIVFLEMALGQFTNMGPVHGWKACPIMTGIGWSMCFIASMISVYYNVIIAWSIFYLFASFRRKLPWRKCNNPWNDELCLESGTKVRDFLAIGQIACSDKVKVNCTKFESATVQYYERVALGFVSYDGVLRTMDDPLGSVQWRLALCLMLSWLLIFLCLVRGIQTSGKIVHFTATFPFIAVLILLVRGVTLPGAKDGLRILITPDFPKLKESKVWNLATNQVFFSLGIGLGDFVTLASYNRINHNCYRDALLVPLVDTAVSMVSGITVFSVLGYMSHKSGLPVETVVESGPGVAFIAFTEAVSTMPAGPVWSILFFITLLTLGVDTQFIMLQTIMTTILDQWPRLRSEFRLELAVKGSFCVAMFLFGLPMCCQGGCYLVDVFTEYSSSYSIYVITLGEVAGICLFYGLGNFLHDIKLMLGFKPGCYWIACWTFFCPALLLFVFCFAIFNYKRPNVARDQTMAVWGEIVGWSLMLMSMLIIIAFTFAWQPSVAAMRRASAHLQQRLTNAMGGGLALEGSAALDEVVLPTEDDATVATTTRV